MESLAVTTRKNSNSSFKPWSLRSSLCWL